MRIRRFTLATMLLLTALAVGGHRAQGDEKPESLFGDPTEVESSEAKTLKFAFHGTNPTRSAFVINGLTAWGVYLGPQGYYREAKLSHPRAVLLLTPWGRHLGVEFTNDGAGPLTPQTFWFSLRPINGPHHVIAATNTAGAYYSFTEDAIGRTLFP